VEQLLESLQLALVVAENEGGKIAREETTESLEVRSTRSGGRNPAWSSAGSSRSESLAN
jgi:hypothetical protein